MARDLYAGNDPEEAWTLACEAEQGQLSVWPGPAGPPLMGFLHYAIANPAAGSTAGEGAPLLLGHLANSNPMLALLEENPRAWFFVQGPAAYVTSYWGGNPRGVPTSYYQWAQLELRVELVRDVPGLMAILEAMLARYQPEGQHPPMDPEDKYWKGLLGAITGLRMQVVGAHSRHKLGQNRPAAHRQAVVAGLRGVSGVGAEQREAVAQQVLARLPEAKEGAAG